jgi:hypothetical protein
METFVYLSRGFEVLLSDEIDGFSAPKDNVDHESQRCGYDTGANNQFFIHPEPVFFS